ncbi:hypothetical protein [Lutispora sp.]|uniref:hypothetical protein n=1 Tax=Lutispora sp. TaxID=2828727 RepID=UPI002B206FEE|nr:hypothetical protein [Lutispora sp.]MEA4961941.1 hypothetical protein [Lutispora sp.]
MWKKAGSLLTKKATDCNAVAFSYFLGNIKKGDWETETTEGDAENTQFLYTIRGYTWMLLLM